MIMTRKLTCHFIKTSAHRYIWTPSITKPCKGTGGLFFHDKKPMNFMNSIALCLKM